MGPTTDYLVIARKVVRISVLAPGGNHSHRILLIFFGAVAEIHENFPVIFSKASDHKHDLKGWAHGIARET